MSKLNLEDRQSWQRFQRVLTSFISDYIDLLAPEQTEMAFEGETLSLRFTLLASQVELPEVNQFTHQLERYLTRLPLTGVRRIVVVFWGVTDEEPLLSHTFPIEFVAPERAIVPNTVRKLSPGKRPGSLVRRVRGWLTHPRLGEAFHQTSKLVIRDPKGALVATGTFVQQQADRALTWIDTFPWEAWAQQKVQWQQRRHRRNFWKALVEDILFVGLFILLVLFGGRLLSGPTLNLASLPPQHYDSTFASARYSCGTSGVSRQNYVCLRRGMSYNEVKKILGAEGKPLAIAPKFGQDTQELKKTLADGKKRPGLFAWFNRKPSVGELTAVIVSWSDGRGGTLNGTFRGNHLIARAYRNIS